MSGTGFGKCHRLLRPEDFQGVFRQARYKVSNREILVLAIETGTPNARLGLVVGKKHLRLAVQRNRFKRIARESFRHHKDPLQGLDIIVLVRGKLSEQDNARIRRSIDTLWQDLIRRRQRDSARRNLSPPREADQNAQ